MDLSFRPRMICSVLSVFALIVAGSCVPTVPENAEKSPDEPRTEAVTVIRSVTFRFDWELELDPLRIDLEKCVADAIALRFADLRYLPKDTFFRTAFPNLAKESVPVDPKSMSVLLDSQTFRQRIDSLNMRYIIYVGGYTAIQEWHEWAGAVGYGGGTFLGGSSWDKQTDVSALVFYLKNPEASKQVSTHATGTSWTAGAFPFIIGYSTDNEQRACRLIGTEVVAAIEAAKAAGEHQ